MNNVRAHETGPTGVPVDLVSDSLLSAGWCSDGENVPESLPRARPSRRAKTAALERTKLDLNPLIDQEANTS